MSNQLGIDAMRMPRAGGLCYELIRNIMQARRDRKGDRTGVTYFNMVSEESAKALIDMLNNSDIFGNPDRRIICNFCVEN